MNEHPILNKNSGDQIPRQALYVGRGSPLGNPYAIGQDGDRDTVIDRYRTWLQARLRERDPVVCTALLRIQPGQALVCHCAPKRCHAEVIVEVLQDPEIEQLRTGCRNNLRYAVYGTHRLVWADSRLPNLIRKVADRLHTRGYAISTAPDTHLSIAFANAAPEVQTVNACSSEALRLVRTLNDGFGHQREEITSHLALHAHCLLGEDLRSPARFLLIWTPDGCENEEAMERKTAGLVYPILRLARAWGIPVFNLQRPGHALAGMAQLIEANGDH